MKTVFHRHFHCWLQTMSFIYKQIMCRLCVGVGNIATFLCFSSFLDECFRQSPFNSRSKSSSPAEASSSTRAAFQGEPNITHPFILIHIVRRRIHAQTLIYIQWGTCCRRLNRRINSSSTQSHVGVFLCIAIGV